MAINRLQASLASATNEVTVAAANINFEFTLVKYEAPKEYQPLGKILSAKRKKDAEYGSSHVTARRLGALFEGVCPNTPNLVKTYGERVSEISKSAIDKGHNEYSQSIFSAYAGVDATSIWAAATSSKAALHVHLLACMLARFWEPPEAVSIWVEIVKKRREDIATKLEDGQSLPFAMATAATQGEISRAQLAEWDASARAWIRTADEIKSRQQTQLQLVLKNIDAPVSQLTNVYSGVLDVWTSALTVMENLLSEMPQAVQDGATLLGLSSWHIYPDLAIFGAQNVGIRMNDMAVPRGGVLSLGLSSPQENSTRGIYWSLSLAHLRFYGPSFRARRRLSEDPKRISFPQLQLATLGVILGYWNVPLEETTESIRLLLAITETLQQSPRWTVQDRWIDMISPPALEYLGEHGEEDSELISRLIHLGRRRSNQFLKQDSSRSDRHFFGLRNLTTLLECLKGPEERLAFLRHMVTKSQNLHKENTIVRYYLSDTHSTEAGKPEMAEIQPSKRPRLSPRNGKSASAWIDNEAQYATAFPQHSPQHSLGLNYNSHVKSAPNEGFHHRWFQNHDAQQRCIPKAEVCHIDSAAQTFTSDLMSIKAKGKNINLSYVCGNPESAAIFTSSSTAPVVRDTSYEDILWCIESGYLDLSKLNELIKRQTSPLFRTLLALVLASKIYNTLPDATVTVSVLNQPLVECHWAKASLYYFFPTPWSQINSMSREIAFSVVAYFEGFIDTDPDNLKDAFALCSGDSIYVAMQVSSHSTHDIRRNVLTISYQLVCDPFETPLQCELKRILGNIGKPGVVFLVSPQAPMVRDRDLGRWAANYSEFDGTAVDSFSRTSLHLSFTDYHVPIFENDSRGDQDSQASILEGVISVRDSGNWIADVGILGAFEEGYISRLPQQSPCSHPDNSAPGRPIIAVESWDDILDNPDGVFVVKAHGNWIARLAVTAVLAEHSRTKKGIKITVVSNSVCWKCLAQKDTRHAFVY
ncbi:hypothetical protein FQN50_004851 [Emmonsiellopsis sp. PD_5]|nr:hypothetical protein FQN50_004851 [Emmonsiellopsis sp. PD_5]